MIMFSCRVVSAIFRLFYCRLSFNSLSDVGPKDESMDIPYCSSALLFCLSPVIPG